MSEFWTSQSDWICLDNLDDVNRIEDIGATTHIYEANVDGNVGIKPQRTYFNQIRVKSNTYINFTPFSRRRRQRLQPPTCNDPDTHTTLHQHASMNGVP